MSTAMIPAEVFHPGEYLREELEERGWSEREFAEIIGRPVQALSEILNGRKDITAETAVTLSDALGTSAELWLNLQGAYRLSLVRAARPEVTPVQRRARLRRLVPVREIQRRGWIPTTFDLDLLEASVCNFLGISTPDEPPRLAVAARRSNALVDFTPQQVAWAARVQQIGGELTAPFEIDCLARLGANLARLIRVPADLGRLRELLQECGVALVIEPPLQGSKIDGVVMFSAEGNPVIGLSTRGDRMDSLLFTLLHEIAHLVLGHVRRGDVRLDEDLVSREGIGIEAAADQQAAEWIFPGGLNVAIGHPTTRSVLAAAQVYGVHPSLVIGRLQKEGRLGWGEMRRSIPKARPYCAQ